MQEVLGKELEVGNEYYVEGQRKIDIHIEE